jgi:hypothetical protein
LESAKLRALKVDIPFDLDREWVSERLLAGVCEATGLPFEFKLAEGQTRNPFAPSIDQIVPSKGYTKDNCRLVAMIYNYAKNNFSDADVLKMATALMSR